MAILNEDFLRLEGKEFNYGKYIHIKRYKHAQKKVSGAVLDIGCGYGYGSYYISQSDKVNKVIGLDIVEEEILHAKKNYKGDKCDFICADALDLPFSDNYFDYIVSFENIEHVKDYNKYLEEIKRVLKPNGNLLLSTPNNRDLNIRLQKYLKKINEWPLKYQENKWHIKEFYYDELVDLFQKYNFKIIDSFGQVLRIPKIPITKIKYFFIFSELFAKFLPKYTLIMVFKLKNIK